jgi:hypothetical protein
VGTSTAKEQSDKDTKSVRFVTDIKTNATHLASEPETTTHHIKELCSAIIASQRPPRGIGFSQLADVLTKQKCEILLITPGKPFLPDTASWSVSSLKSVLRDPRFVQLGRLKLSIKLASSILQLHETPWLHETWCKDGKFFVNRTGSTHFDQAFVHHKFKRSELLSTPTVPSCMERIIRNQTLYALGVELIELNYRKPISALHQNTDGNQNTGDSFLDLLTKVNTADRMAEALWSEADAKISDAVRRCIRCDCDQRASSLEDRKFQEAVFRGVVAQLQENYKYLLQGY